ncbi:MAG: hypothetical protein AAGF55_17250 [Pseudomonadota bacterium]
MSNEDSFISEVTEEVRRDRLFALMRRYGWIGVLAIVVIVGGAGVFEWRKATAQAEAEAAGDALLAALQQDDATARANALSELDIAEDPGQRAVLALLQSAASLEINENAAASAALDGVVADSEVPQLYRDLALLKRVLAATDLAAEERISLLQPLMQAGNPFRLLAVEQRAFAEIELGETDTAIQTLQDLLADAEASEDLRRRAGRLIVSLGGSLDQG